jgi:chaperonin GroES
MSKTSITKTEKAAPKLKPLMGYILVVPDKAETTTASGIILPESAKEAPAQGKVLAVGEDTVFDSGKVLRSPVKVGDRVVYKKWGGDEIKISGVEYKLVQFTDLMGILED